MRRFLFNGAILGALFSGLGTLKTTVKGPRDWRLALLWLSWAISITLAVSDVLENSRDSDSSSR